MKKAECLILFLLFSVYIHSERRLALIIGNSEYGKGNFLENPVHDAEDISGRLQLLGFDIMKVCDGNLRTMYEAVSEFAERARKYDIALFYYSGHGLQTKGENYLVPIDAELRSEADVRYSCLSLNLLLDKLDESDCPMKIVVLDACRNNPFARRWYRGSGLQGLASVSPPKGTYITFSTAAGSVALDGTGRNSPYTSAFLSTLDVPGLSLFDFFNEVGQLVLSATNNEQDPWTNHNTMTGKFFFNNRALSESSGTSLSNSIFPEWINSKGKDEWIGVSVPMTDKTKAKKNAIINALIQYAMKEGGLQMSMNGEISIRNFHGKVFSREQWLSSIDSQFHTLCKLSKFKIQVKKEFMNSRNEYFVLVSITKDNSSPNQLLIGQEIMNEEKKALLYTVEADIDKVKTNINFSFCYDSFMLTKKLMIDDVLSEDCFLKYPNKTISNNTNGTNPYFITSISTYGSLGLSQLAVLAQLPIVPDSVILLSRSLSQADESNNEFENETLFSAGPYTKSLPIEFISIRDGLLGISVTDPYERFRDNKKNNQVISQIDIRESEKSGIPSDFLNLKHKITDKNYLESSNKSEPPFWLGKTEAMYLSIQDIASKIESNVDIIGNEMVTKPISNYSPFFFMDGNHSDFENDQFAREWTSVIFVR